jgi:membrane-associated phospholipid phosphatase
MTRAQLTFVALAFLILEAVLIGCVDRPLSEYLRTVDAQRPEIINIFRAYTDIAKSKWYLILSGIGILLCAIVVRIRSVQLHLREKISRLGRVLLFFFACAALSGIVADIIKPILGRARPVLLEREGLYGFHPFTFQATWNSMPSGHTTTAFVIAAVLTFLLPRGKILWFLFALAIAASRVMVNAHYLSDVLAGAAVGILSFVLLRSVINHNVTNHITYGIFPIDRKKPVL